MEAFFFFFTRHFFFFLQRHWIDNNALRGALLILREMAAARGGDIILAARKDAIYQRLLLSELRSAVGACLGTSCWCQPSSPLRVVVAQVIAWCIGGAESCSWPQTRSSSSRPA